MPSATLPFAPQDIELLRRVGAGARSAPWTLVVCGVLLLCCAGGLFAIGRLVVRSSPGMTLTLDLCALATLAFAAVVVVVGIRRDRRARASLHAVLAQGHKTVLQGRLQQAGMVGGGRLRYTIDGQAIDVLPVLGLDTRTSHVAGRVLRAFTHLADLPVELHCVPWGAGLALLLQLHYPLARRAERSQRPAVPGDRRRAGLADSRFMAIVAAVAALAVLGGAWASGFDRGMTLFFALFAAGVWSLVYAFGALPGRLRARRLTHFHAVRGPVTEIVVAPVADGRHWVDAAWYRVDGQLFPAFGLDVDAALGNQVCVEFLGAARGEDGGRVLAVQRTAAAAA